MHLTHLATAAFLFVYSSMARPVDEPNTSLLSVPWPYWNYVNADFTTVVKRDATPTNLARDAAPTDTADADPDVYINTDYITYDIPLHTTITYYDTTVTWDNFVTLGGTIYPWIHFTNAIRDVVPTDIPDADADAYASPSEPFFAEAKPTLEAMAQEAPSDAAAQTSKFFPEIVLESPGASSTRTESLPSDFFEERSTRTTSSAKSVITPIDLTQETVITPIKPWWTTSSSHRVGTTLVKVVATHTVYYDEEPSTTSASTTNSLVTDIGTWTKTVPV